MLTAGIDVGSTYTKAVVLRDGLAVAGRALARTGFRLAEAARQVYDDALADAGAAADEVAYLVATGFGRHQVRFRDVQVTDLTATARGVAFLFPGARTVLDIGGQTMKASRLDENGKVRSFRLNDKCAAGSGAFLEKTARYLGFSVEEIGPLVATSKEPVPISGVCAVFAESEVINHLSLGAAPADILRGAVVSLVGRAVQLMKRLRSEPEYVLVGGIVRYPTLAAEVRDALGHEVSVPAGDLVQFAGALGAALLGHRRLLKLGQAAVEAVG